MFSARYVLQISTATLYLALQRQKQEHPGKLNPFGATYKTLSQNKTKHDTKEYFSNIFRGIFIYIYVFIIDVLYLYITELYCIFFVLYIYI